MDIKEHDRLRALQRKMFQEQRKLRLQSSTDSTIDPTQTYNLLPSFMTDAFNIHLQSFHQRLNIILTAVPTNEKSMHQSIRTLQASGHATISKRLRSVLQQEEAQKIMHRPQSRGATVSSARPGTASAETLKHNSKRNMVKLSEDLHASQAAMAILTATKPKPTERDREFTTNKVPGWSAPRRVPAFIYMMKEAIDTFVKKSRRSVEENEWYATVLAHQEERGTHCIGDRDTLMATLKEFRRTRNERMQRLDEKIRTLEMEQNRYGRQALVLETDFENDLQSMWQEKRTVASERVQQQMRDTMAKDQKQYQEMAEDHKLEVKQWQKKIQRRETELKELAEKKDAVFAVKNLELQQEEEVHQEIKRRIMRIQEEIVDKEMQKKRRAMEFAVQQAVNVRKEQYAKEDAIKLQLKLAQEAVVAEEERVREEKEAEQLKKEEGEAGGKKKARKKKK
jgi:hypothetical protein